MKRKYLKICLVVIAVCLLIPVFYMLSNRSTKRAPTPEEVAVAEAFQIDWQTEDGVTEQEVILSLCTFLEDKTIGVNSYRCYSPNGLELYLPDFFEMTEIAQLEENLYIQYNTQSGNMVTLGYSPEGLTELAIYYTETDTLYHDLQGNVEVWEKFRNGFQFGQG